MAKKQTNLIDIINNEKSEKLPQRPKNLQQERIEQLTAEIRYHRHLYYK